MVYAGLLKKISTLAYAVGVVFLNYVKISLIRIIFADGISRFVRSKFNKEYKVPFSGSFFFCFGSGCFYQL